MPSLFSSAQLLSLVLFVTLSHVGVATIFAAMWHSHRHIRALSYWSAGELVIAGAFSCLLLRPLEGDASLANILCTNLLLMTTIPLYERGMRHFFRREADQLGWLLPAVTLGGFALFALTALQHPLSDVHSRIIVLSGVLSLQIALLIWQLWRYQRLAPVYRVLRFAILLLGLQLLLQLLRIAKHLWYPELAANTLPAEGVAGRLGGDELALLLAQPLDLTHYCHTLQQQIADATRELAGGPISLSIGLTSLHPDEGFEHAYLRADRALYAAKQTGRQRACVQEPHHSEPQPLQPAHLLS